MEEGGCHLEDGLLPLEGCGQLLSKLLSQLSANNNEHFDHHQCLIKLNGVQLNPVEPDLICLVNSSLVNVHHPLVLSCAHVCLRRDE